jgi:CysZ protein
MILGWFTPLGPVLLLVSSAMTISFLAWDYTDLVPARHMIPFKTRIRSFLKAGLFHLGFGLPFLVPVLNILFLSFAPVGATLYYLDRHRPNEERD